jgi:hypothetical protein
MTGATTIVAAMATSAWQATRTTTARLFRRRGQPHEAAITTQLDSHAARVARTDDTDRARRSLLPQWQMELEDLLREYPEAADELQDLIRQTQEVLPQTQKAFVQNVIASAPYATAQGAMFGNVITYGSVPRSDLPTGPPETEPIAKKRNDQP